MFTFFDIRFNDENVVVCSASFRRKIANDKTS